MNTRSGQTSGKSLPMARKAPCGMPVVDLSTPIASPVINAVNAVASSFSITPEGSLPSQEMGLESALLFGGMPTPTRSVFARQTSTFEQEFGDLTNVDLTSEVNNIMSNGPAQRPVLFQLRNTQTPVESSREADGQLFNCLGQVVANLHATGSAMDCIRSDESIRQMRSEHCDRAGRLIPLLMDPNGTPLSYRYLTSTNPSLVKVVERLQERHAQLASQLNDIRRTDAVIDNALAHRQIALSRMQQIDEDYARVLDQLSTYVESQPTYQGIKWTFPKQ